MRVTWDDKKNAANKRKHGISLAEAAALLESDHHLVLFDETHSDDEDRFISIGPIARGVVLVVWTERRVDEVRIISARLATSNERQLFEQYIAGKP